MPRRRLAETERDYAGAAALLEGLSGNLRDATLYSSLCERRDRVARLDQQILKAVQARDLENLHPMVVQLLELIPERDDLRRLVEFFTKQDEARHLIEERRDVVRAEALIETVPEYLRDGKLMDSLRVLKERAARLVNVIREERKARHLMDLRQPLEELDRLTPGRDDLKRMIKAVAKNEEAQKLVENRGDYTGALALLEHLPESLRHAKLYSALSSRRDRVNALRKEIEDDLVARRINRLRLKIEEFSRLQKESICDPLSGRALLDVVSTHDEAHDLVVTTKDYDGAVALMNDLPEHLRDHTFYQSLVHKCACISIDKIINECNTFIENHGNHGILNPLITTTTIHQARETGLDAMRLRERLASGIDRHRIFLSEQRLDQPSTNINIYEQYLNKLDYLYKLYTGLTGQPNQYLQTSRRKYIKPDYNTLILFILSLISLLIITLCIYYS